MTTSENSSPQKSSNFQEVCSHSPYSCQLCRQSWASSKGYSEDGNVDRSSLSRRMTWLLLHHPSLPKQPAYFKWKDSCRWNATHLWNTPDWRWGGWRGSEVQRVSEQFTVTRTSRSLTLSLKRSWIATWPLNTELAAGTSSCTSARTSWGFDWSQ